MKREQRLVIIMLGIADVLVLACLITAVALTPRLRPAPVEPTAAPSPVRTATNTPEPTWTSTPSPSPAPSPTPYQRPTSLPTFTPVVFPTNTPTPTPTREPVVLENADFNQIFIDVVPGWNVAAVVNWEPGDEFSPETSFGAPQFKPADDPVQRIDGTTLQIESAHQYVKFQLTIYQLVEVIPGSRVQFEIKTRGFSSQGGIYVAAGIDPSGGAACTSGRWGERQLVDQTMGVTLLQSPTVVAGAGGTVAVCFFAEAQYPVASKAAFFDDALLLVIPPGE
ncbi:MAG: hypothetical protein JW900_15055 [Anaerolineae bacterium]|nr:hypothetical protein [Anaerolineae bacterium]